MKRILTTLLVLVAAVAIAVPAYAEEGGGRRGKHHKRHAGKIFERLDKNADGVLTSDEVPERLWARLSKADADGDGAVSKAELKAAHKKRCGKKRGRKNGGSSSTDE